MTNIQFGISLPSTLTFLSDKGKKKGTEAPAQTPTVETGSDAVDLSCKQKVRPETTEALVVFDDSYGSGITPRGVLKTVIELYDEQSAPHRKSYDDRLAKYEKNKAKYDKSWFRKFRTEPFKPLNIRPADLKVSDLETAFARKKGGDLTAETKEALEQAVNDLSKWGFISITDYSGFKPLEIYPKDVAYDLKDAKAE